MQAWLMLSEQSKNKSYQFLSTHLLNKQKTLSCSSVVLFVAGCNTHSQHSLVQSVSQSGGLDYVVYMHGSTALLDSK